MIFDSYWMTCLYIGVFALITLQRKIFPSLVWRNITLFLASILILTQIVSFASLIKLLIIAVLVFTLAFLLHKLSLKQHSKISYILIIGSLGTLIIGLLLTKYDWPKELLSKWVNTFSPQDQLIETIGISYIFFKFVHVLVDSFRGQLPKMPFLTFLNYIFFFPTYLSGPIDRFSNFSTWMNHSSSIKRDALFYSAALYRLLLGSVKKFLLVPFFLTYTKDFGQVFHTPYFILNLMLSLFAYSFYIYSDFSGYSDYAVAYAMLLGFKMPENFQKPYLAKNIADFWRRWHISLSSILKDYVFIPTVRSTSKFFPRLPRLSVSIFGYLITFLICGLWHGNTIGFAIWGLWHGVGLSLHKLWQQLPFNRPTTQLKTNWLRWSINGISLAVTFWFVSVGWLFFTYSFNEIRSIEDIAKLDLSAQPFYYYNDTYTWGAKITVQPSQLKKVDLQYRTLLSNQWTTYLANTDLHSNTINVYGGIEASSPQGNIKNLPQGKYEFRMRYQQPDGKQTHWIGFLVTIPDYQNKIQKTADDLQAKAVYIPGAGWKIQLKYQPPDTMCKVDIEYKAPGEDKWIPYQKQRSALYHFVRIDSDKLSALGEDDLGPGVHGVRIRYTNPREGYFSDWTQTTVAIPKRMNS